MLFLVWNPDFNSSGDDDLIALIKPLLMILLCLLQNPGFDFSQAQFSGNCPDPRTFMGGIRSD